MNTLNTRSGASLNPYMSKIDICESEPADFLSFGSSNFILRRRAFRLKDYDPTDSLQLRFEFDDDDLESFLNIGIIKVGFQINASCPGRWLVNLKTNQKEVNYVGIYFNFTAWQEYIGGVPKKPNGELRFPNPINTLKLGFGKIDKNGEISTGTHLIVIPEIECGVVTGTGSISLDCSRTVLVYWRSMMDSVNRSIGRVDFNRISSVFTSSRSWIIGRRSHRRKNN